MSRQYNLELTDLKAASNKIIAKSKYLITDEDGNFLGKGLTIHDNVYFLKTLFLKEGQYGKMRLYHIMRRDPLPGISDVGIIIEKHF